MFELSVSSSFEASHFIHADGAPSDYRRMHGHSYVVTASIAEPAPSTDGWVLDLGSFEAALKETVADLDHQVLNDIEGLAKPTFENLLVWIDRRLRARGYAPSRLEIERPTLRHRAVYTP